MRSGRPAKPMFPVDEAFEDLDEGALSYEGAADFTSFGITELKLAVKAKEIEVFHRGRRVLLVKRSVRQWLAKMLADERQRKAAEGL